MAGIFKRDSKTDTKLMEKSRLYFQCFCLMISFPLEPIESIVVLSETVVTQTVPSIFYT